MTGIRDRARMRQIIDFHDLDLGTIRPTDIDGLIEYQNRAFILFELKLTTAALDVGQRLAFERMVNRWTRGGAASIAIIAEHACTDAALDVVAADCRVREYYYWHQWRLPDAPRTLRAAIHQFIEALP